MNKRKVTRITLEFADGGPNHTYHNIDATFSTYKNARKAGGYKNSQEWTEFHITWVTYVQPITASALSVLEENNAVEKVDRETLRGKAWCSQHNSEPGDCYRLHNPNAFREALEAEMKIAEQDAERWKKEFAKPLLEPKPPKYIDFFADFNEGYGNGKH